MRRRDSGMETTLDEEQYRAAENGMKAMIPASSGRPFLDYVISGLADAGIEEVCIVVGASPEHDAVRQHYGRSRVTRVQLSFATQEEPRGTADALLAAEAFADDDHVLSVNADNYYPVRTLRALRALDAAGVSVFERSALIEHSNVPPERVAQYAVVVLDDEGMLRRIIEKPDAGTLARLREPVYVGMNSWSFPPQIFEACRRIRPSPRGELELQSAVQLARDRMGVHFRALVCHEGVLDLSTRADIAAVAQRLAGVQPRL